MSRDSENHGPNNRPKRPMDELDAQKKSSSSSEEETRYSYREKLTAGTDSERDASPRGKKPATEPKEKKPKRKGRVRRGLLIAGSVILLLCIGVFGLYNWLQSQLRGESTVAGPIPSAVKTNTIPEYTGKGIVAGLFCGIDYDNDDADGYDDDAVGRTDVILYIMFDTINNKANLLQIPRDAYVGPDVETDGEGKINGLYYNAEDPNNRIKALADVIYDQLGLPIDFYITLDMDAVKALIDTLGSIAVYVPIDVKDPVSDNVMAAGWQWFDGSQAEFFLRNRNYADADLTRLVMQQSFYSALFREFKTLAPQDLVMWMQVLLKYAKVGGLDLLQLGGLAQKALNIGGADITFVRPPVNGARLNGRDLVSFVADETADLLNQYFRPDGHEMSVEELNIYELPMFEGYGKSETYIKTMDSIQDAEPPLPP